MHTSSSEKLAALIVTDRGSVDDLLDHRLEVIACDSLVLSSPAKFLREAFVL